MTDDIRCCATYSSRSDCRIWYYNIDVKSISVLSQRLCFDELLESTRGGDEKRRINIKVSVVTKDAVGNDRGQRNNRKVKKANQNDRWKLAEKYEERDVAEQERAATRLRYYNAVPSVPASGMARTACGTVDVLERRGLFSRGRTL